VSASCIYSTSCTSETSFCKQALTNERTRSVSKYNSSGVNSTLAAMSMDIQRELARRKNASTGREQESVKAGMATDMEALRRLAQTAPTPTASSKEAGGGGGILRQSVALSSTIKGSQSPRPTSAFSVKKTNNDNSRSVSPGAGATANLPPSALKAQPVPRASLSNERRPTSMGGSPTSSSDAGPERRGSFNVKAKQSIYLGGTSGGGGGGGGAGDDSVKLAVDDPLVVERINGLTAQVAELTRERDWLNKERLLWLSRVEADNTRLASMLRNVRDAKKRLIEEMDSVQAEKGKLKSLQLQLQHNELKSTTYPLSEDDCVIGAARRELMAPQSRQDAAKALHERLLAMVSKVHSNFVEINTFISSKVDESIKGFIDFRPDVTEKCLEALANIANAAPGNMKDAEAAAASLSEAMVGAVLGKSIAVLRVRAENAGFNAAEKNAHDFESKEMESKSLLVQNETLKVNLAQMRKKYTTLLEKATNKAKETEAKPKFDESSKRSTPLSPPPFRAGGADYLPSHLPPAAPVNLYEVLPFEIKQLANKLTSQYIQTLAENNPLSDGIKKYMIKEAIAEVSVQQQSTLGLILHAYKDNHLIAFDGSMKEEPLEDVIRTALRTPEFTRQATVNVHMVLTYLFQRQRTHDPSSGKQDAEATETKDNNTETGDTAASKFGMVNKLAVKSTKLKQPEAVEYVSSDNRNFVSGDKKRPAANNIFIASTGEEEVMTLRPPDNTSEDKKKKLPAFMQAVPKKKINRD